HTPRCWMVRRHGASGRRAFKVRRSRLMASLWWGARVTHSGWFHSRAIKLLKRCLLFTPTRLYSDGPATTHRSMSVILLRLRSRRTSWTLRRDNADCTMSTHLPIFRAFLASVPGALRRMETSTLIAWDAPCLTSTLSKD